MLRIVLCFLVSIMPGCFLAYASGTNSPELRIEAAPELAAFRARLNLLDPKIFDGVLQLVGIDNAGPPIRVILASESSDWARQTPPWTAGFAVGAADLVVIFPARSPGYPDNSLEDVLRHEVAHILVARAAEGHPVPRWFNEGLAMAAEGSWGLKDQTRVLYELVLGPRITLSQINRLFLGDRRDQDRAYALSGAFMRDLLREHGATAPGKILGQVRLGVLFDEAFADEVGGTLFDAEAEFWRRQRMWTTWVPIITSSATVWLLITFIALLAIRRRRQKDAEIRNRWDQEEAESDDP